MPALLTTDIPGLPVRRGKVRDVYDLGDKLLLIATDRISAFDWVMPNGIPDKGRILTQISAFWFELLGGLSGAVAGLPGATAGLPSSAVPSHVLSLDLDEISLPATVNRADLAGRSMVVRKCQVVPIECVVRGYLDGSGWKEYRQTGTVCEERLPAGLVQCSKLPEPVFTPATKEESGHDINIPFARMVEGVGQQTADELRRRSIDVYSRAAEYAATKGLLIADTKFEWGWHDGQLILIDEVLTPDSSRFWPADQYQPGRPQPSYDKQFVRDWLETTGWDKNSPPPTLPGDVVARTRQKYVEAYERLTGLAFASSSLTP
jgi:phosphoribosylaminoimidazole-succinocarboxamide synthase